MATKPVDFRKGHDGLAALVKNELRKEPFTGTVFVFRAKRAGRLKLLYWDGTGLVMAYKRLEEHTEPPRVYRRVFCSNVRQLYQGRSCLHRRLPPLLVA